ncbi:hypothetical protein J4573_25130 [Actinomadura barringtoniae]|uniref:Uncharacterized protein n=1 Tax=Actinomadura barringtoniae TaxID=1427535 RepID=A0A939PD44_9ACTN|nr:hypothetical protein [Actinomadura barringtoniae]MBO2450410.1 hypothetical protein [Actinomadura barringtoniae]
MIRPGRAPGSSPGPGTRASKTPSAGTIPAEIFGVIWGLGVIAIANKPFLRRLSAKNPGPGTHARHA